jgi:hypothetical protein
MVDLKSNLMAKIITSPEPLQDGFSVFLAGSIEMGIAENWQSRVERGLSESEIVIFNPRRKDWDASWVQSIDNLRFKEQVEWELSALEKADIIALYFDPTTQSPISLLELGLFANTDKRIVVCCPQGFWRKGNVDIVCVRYSIPQVDSLDKLIEHIAVIAASH